MTNILTLAEGNALLAALPEGARRELAANLQPVALPLTDVLHRPGAPIDAVYFPLSGVVSIVADLDGDQTVEVATVGYEGMVGLSLFLGARSPTERALVQVGGQALRIGADDFLRCAEVVDGPLHAALRRYSQWMFTQLARNSACNRTHTVTPRAARWLLTVADRMRASTFELTQEFLAQMLTVRRATVNGVARELADEGCITYVRGTIHIVDRERLHARACACYDALRAATPTSDRAA